MTIDTAVRWQTYLQVALLSLVGAVGVLALLGGLWYLSIKAWRGAFKD